jgi:hypothetical protein
MDADVARTWNPPPESSWTGCATAAKCELAGLGGLEPGHCWAGPLSPRQLAPTRTRIRPLVWDPNRSHVESEFGLTGFVLPCVWHIRQTVLGLAGPRDLNRNDRARNTSVATVNLKPALTEFLP